MKKVVIEYFNTNDKRVVIALDFSGKPNNWIITTYNRNESKANATAYPHQNIQMLNTSSPIAEKSLNSNTKPQNEVSLVNTLTQQEADKFLNDCMNENANYT